MDDTTCSPSSEGGERRRRGALLRAAMDGDLDLVARMAMELKRESGTGAGGVWSTCGHNALHLAVANGRTRVCRHLVQDLGLPLSSSGDTPLVLAATYGHTTTAAYLLERGADARAPDCDGQTTLHWVAYNGDRDLAALLLQKGADADAANPRGTALHVAAAQAHPELVSILLRHGADPNEVAKGVYTPLVGLKYRALLPCLSRPE